MDRDAARRLLDEVATGVLGVENALAQLVAAPFAGFLDLGFARLDTHRGLRTGEPEVVYGAGKSTEQIVAIVERLVEAHPKRPILVTRIEADARSAIKQSLGQHTVVEDRVARCIAVGPMPEPAGHVVVVSAGTSDESVAAEAAFVARMGGADVERIADVGVAGLHRVLAHHSRLDNADCLVVVAGMDGALPSVVGGLTGVPLVAVPTSVGYGTALGGFAALLSMLNSCAPGVVVTNIDNGFGAGVFAARVARRAAVASTRATEESEQ